MSKNNELILNRLEEVIVELNHSGHEIMSLNQLFIKTGMGPSSASMYANGVRNLGFKTLKAISDTYNVSLDYLRNGTLPMFTTGVVNEPSTGYERTANEASHLRSTVKLLQDMIDILEATVEDKEEIISLLKYKYRNCDPDQ